MEWGKRWPEGVTGRENEEKGECSSQLWKKSMSFRMTFDLNKRVMAL